MSTHHQLRRERDLPCAPRRGEAVLIDGRRYRVSHLTWTIADGQTPWVNVTLIPQGVDLGAH